MQRTVIALIALVAIGCGREDPPKPPPAPAPVALLEPGAEPRTALRYRIEAGTRSAMTAELDVTIDAGGQGGVLPTLVLDLETTCEGVLPDGRARMRLAITAVRSRERAGSLITTEALDAHAELLRGLAFTGVLAPDGTLAEVAIDRAGKLIPPGLDAQLDTMSKTFQQVAMPLPTEPVGAGARWQYKKPIEHAGMRLVATTNVALASIDGPRVAFSLTSMIGGPDQSVTQAGTTIRMTNIAGDGKTSGVVDLSRMVMTGEQTMSFHSEMAGADQNARMGMTTTLRLAERAAEVPPPPPPTASPADAAGVDDAAQGAQSAP